MPGSRIPHPPCSSTGRPLTAPTVGNRALVPVSSAGDPVAVEEEEEGRYSVDDWSDDEQAVSKELNAVAVLSTEYWSYEDLVAKWARLYSEAHPPEGGEEGQEEEPGQEAVEYATELLKRAAGVTGIGLKTIRGQKIIRKLAGPPKTKVQGGKASPQRASPQRNIEAESEETDEETEAEIDALIREEQQKEKRTLGGKVLAKEIARQRAVQNQQFLRRCLLKLDHQVQKDLSVLPPDGATGGGGGSVSRGTRRGGESADMFTPARRSGSNAPTVERDAFQKERGDHMRSTVVIDKLDQRIQRERRKFTERVLKVVSDMRNMVVKRKAEVSRHLALQEKEKKELVDAYEQAERQRLMAHRAQCRETMGKWKSDVENEKQARREKKRTDQLKREMESEFQKTTLEGSYRREDQMQALANLAGNKRRARQDLYEQGQRFTHSQQQRQDRQREEDEANRAEAKRVRNVVDQQRSADRLAEREKARRDRYETALRREDERQQHIADVAAYTADKERRVRNRQLRELRQKDEEGRQKEAHRQTVFDRSEQIKRDEAEATDNMIKLQTKLSDQHWREYEHNMAKKRDYYRQQNKIRMNLADQHARATKFKQDEDRASWELRKHTLEKQDKEIWCMKQQLRQDKERVAMQTTFLKLSQKKGDLKRLDQFVNALDSELSV